MTLRKITVDNSVRYVPKSEQTREIKQNMIKSISPPRKQKKTFHKTVKKILKNPAREGFGVLKGIMNCYF